MSSSHRGRQSKRRSRGQIDTKIVQLRHQNYKLPISRLPPELLSSIFLYARDGADDRKQSHAVLVVSWVSLHWREVVLSNPFLWNILDVRGEDLVNIFLTRSRQVKLSVSMWAESPNDLVAIVKELGRLQSLRLMCPEIDEDDDDLIMHDDTLLQPHWSQSAPYLRELSLENFPIPPNPFNNTTPALRHVHLIWCNFDWDSFPFPNLTELQIICPGDIINPAQFVQKLQQMPALERLLLDGVLVGTDGPASVRLNLPHLKYISVGTVDPTTLVDLLQRISLPSTAEIVVQPDNCGDLVNQIITELRACQDGARKQLARFNLQAQDTHFSIETTSVPTPPNEFGTSIQGSFGQWTFDDSVTDGLLHHYDFSALTSLTLHSDDQPISADIWTTVLSPLPQVEVVDLCGAFATTFINHLVKSAGGVSELFASDSDTKIEDVVSGKLREKMIFPSLKSLGLHRKGFFSPGGLDGPEDTKWPGDFAIFRFVLGMRWLMGCGIRHLTITRFSLTLARIQDLRRTVDQFSYERDWVPQPVNELDWVVEHHEVL
ncbi:hypothetical protein BDN72DRAFT_840198 [Pluteus cervinus]|uniref:Uncharacterized protein n=1 Tax=Pluteus cervinus TaxID=181527 RepID=A0ACD3AWF6_9AGAR|nr:hypothetical protein BDN72DRAFT_840198 [Pluteus cervinus]